MRDGSEESFGAGGRERLEVVVEGEMGSVDFWKEMGAGSGLQSPSSPTTTGPRPCWEGSEESWGWMETGEGEELVGVGVAWEGLEVAEIKISFIIRWY